MKKQTILLVLSIIFFGIFIAKYSNNYREEISLATNGTSSADYRGYALSFGWEESNQSASCQALPERGVAYGYPFIRFRQELECGPKLFNQTAVVFNTTLSFVSSALIVYGLFGAIKGYRQYRVALRQHYQ